MGIILRDGTEAREILKERPDVIYLCEFNLSPSKILDSLIINDGEHIFKCLFSHFQIVVSVSVK